MNKFLIAVTLLCSASGGAIAQSIDIPLGSSSYFGRIDLGNLSRPPVIYQEPIFAQRPDNYRTVQPQYLRVPPGHAKKWSKHCSRYNACGQPVYFVQDSWYQNTYAPSLRKTHGGGHKDKSDRGYQSSERNDSRNDYRDNGKGDKHDKHQKHDRDNGQGKGHGNGKH